MSILDFRAYCKLLEFDIFLAGNNFAGLYRKVHAYPIHPRSWQADDIDKICHAIDVACIWYWKQALCLQRSAATACLLKQYGVPAQMSIGAQQVPFRAHAWVEVDGQVVNDKPYVREIYAALDLL